MKPADFYAANRGGGLGTMLVSQRIGALAAVVFHRLGWSPTVMSLLNLLLGLAASVGVLLAAPARLAPLAVGLGALALWHLAYGLDCGDGQLARVTRTGSPAGARIDILCDVALQLALVAATSAVAAEYSPDAPGWLYAAFAGTWAVNLVTSVMQTGDAGGSMITSQSLPVKLIKLIRDYAFVITVIGLVLAFAPQWMIWVVIGFTAINGLFLVASIAFTARTAQRAWAAASATQAAERS